jgi:hypothetical protein
MSDAGILPPIAAIGMSLAGFAGVIAALLRGTGEWRPLDLLLIRTQVSYGFAAVVFALVPFPLATLVGESLSMRVASLALLVFAAGWGFVGARASRRTGLSWRRRLPFTAFAPIHLGVVFWCALDPRRPVYELALMTLLVYTMPVFFFALTELRQQRA